MHGIGLIGGVLVSEFERFAHQPSHEQSEHGDEQQYGQAFSQVSFASPNALEVAVALSCSERPDIDNEARSRK